MNYTDKEIEIIKQIAYDKGRMEGVTLTLIITILFLSITLYCI